jgi:hypothetical protein
MIESKVAELVPTKSDADVARELKAELQAPLDQVCAVLNRARAAGLMINIGLPTDQFGRFRHDVSVVKPIL